MSYNPSAPATKGELRTVEEKVEFLKQQLVLLQSKDGATQENMRGMLEYITRNDLAIYSLQNAFEELKEGIIVWKADIVHQFHIVAEDLRHDLLYGVLNDKIEQHEDRIVVLEKHTLRH